MRVALLPLVLALMATAFIPSNLDLENFLKDNPPSFKYHIDKFRYIISLITEIPAFNKDLLEKSSYVPINAAELQRRIHNYKKYLDYLVDNGILKTDNHYVVGQESRGFRFTQQFRTLVKPEQITLYTLVKNIESKTKFEQGMEKKYAHLRRWFNEKLKIDYEGAMKYLHEEFKANEKAGVKNALLKLNSNCVSAYRLKEHDYVFSVDANIGRLHTNLTNLKGELRNFLTYEGKAMVSVDYANSQPCLSSALLDENFYVINLPDAQHSSLCTSLPSFNIYNVTNSLSLFSHLSSSIKDILSYIMIVKYWETYTGIGFKPYVTSVSEGKLYAYIQEQVRDITGVNITEKKKLKEVVFTVLFTDNRFIGQPEAEPKRIFRNLFPDTYEVFAMIKRGDSTTLPRLLQTIESKLMLDHVAKRIAQECPTIPIYTIHDSIACTVDNKDYVAKVMREEMQKAIGVTPTVKFEYWKSENVSGGKPNA